MHRMSYPNDVIFYYIITLAAFLMDGSRQSSLASRTLTAFRTSSGRFKYLSSKKLIAAGKILG